MATPPTPSSSSTATATTTATGSLTSGAASDPIILEPFGSGAIVWDADVCMLLRREYRIVGILCGSLPSLPSQVTWSGLPLVLSKEETNHLINEIKVAKLSKPPPREALLKEDSPAVKKACRAFLDDSYQNQIGEARSSKKRKIFDMIDQIAEGRMKKRKKGDDGDEAKEFDEEKTKEDIVDEMFGSIQDLQKTQMLVQTFLAPPPWRAEPDHDDTSGGTTSKSNEDTSSDLSCSCKVYSDLWHRDFTVTDGAKFGADFLAYPGDPLRYHAQMVVTCVEQDPTEIKWRQKDLVAKCRLASSVKKTAALAYLDESGNVQYQKLIRNDKKKQ